MTFLNLNNRTVFITGSTQGVGRAIAIACAKAGADVLIHGLNNDASAQQSINACAATGVRVDSVFGDLAGPTDEAVSNVFQQAIDVNPNIDILINNAGTYCDVPFLEMELDRYERTMRLNVASYFFMTQSFAKHWVRNQTQGRVLMIGSINGRLAESNHSAYDTSKGAVEMMVKTLSVELAPHEIRVNGLAPGLFYTPLTAPGLDDPKVMQWMKLHTPNQSVPGPEVAGDAAVFLVSDAASHILGQMLMVDGGMSVWQQPDSPE